MSVPLTVTVAPASVTLTRDKEGIRPGEATFTVTNTGRRSVTGRATLTPLGAVEADWLSVAEEPEREFEPDATHTFTVRVAPPADAPAGRHGFRLNMVDVHRPDEGEVEGPEVAVEVPDAVPTPPPVPRWLYALIAALVLVGAVIAGLVLLGDDPPRVSDLADQSAPAGEPIDLAFTVEDEDPGEVTIEVTASDTELVPDDALEVTGTGGERTLTLTPASGEVGATDVTVVARDAAGLEDSVTFALEVVRRFGAWEVSTWDDATWGP